MLPTAPSITKVSSSGRTCFTSDPASATKFYTGLLGWSADQIDQKGKAYTIFSNDGHPVAGLAPHSAGKAGLSSRWIGFVAVNDINASIAATKKLGGAVHAPARKFPDRGFQAIVADVEGVPLGLLQSTSGDSPDDEPKPGDWNWFETLCEKSEERGRLLPRCAGL